jgi:hypothetical protein
VGALKLPLQQLSLRTVRGLHRFARRHGWAFAALLLCAIGVCVTYVVSFVEDEIPPPTIHFGISAVQDAKWPPILSIGQHGNQFEATIGMPAQEPRTIIDLLSPDEPV